MGVAIGIDSHKRSLGAGATDELAERLDSISGAAQTRPKPVHFLEVDAHK